MKNKLFKIFTALMLGLSLTIFTLAQRSAPPVNLNVTIDDGINLQYGIHSDGNPYINGQNSVSAQFGQYGYFTLNSGSRVINALYPPNPNFTQDSKPGTVITTFADGTFLQKMTVGAIVCKSLAVNIKLGDAAQTTRTIGYRAGRGDLSTTGYVKISHPDINTWIMESNSSGGCGSFDNTARIRDAKTKGKPSPDIDYGTYFMPLRLVLTRQL